MIQAVKKDISCLMRCYRNFNGYIPLYEAIQEYRGSCVHKDWVALAINSTKQLLARRELSRLDCVITEHASSPQQPSSQPIKRSRHESCNDDYEEEHTAKRAPMRASHQTPNTHSHDSCHTMQHSLSAVARMTRARAVQHVTENDKK